MTSRSQKEHYTLNSHHLHLKIAPIMEVEREESPSFPSQQNSLYSLQSVEVFNKGRVKVGSHFSKFLPAQINPVHGMIYLRLYLILEGDDSDEC